MSGGRTNLRKGQGSGDGQKFPVEVLITGGGGLSLDEEWPEKPNYCSSEDGRKNISGSFWEELERGNISLQTLYAVNQLCVQGKQRNLENPQLPANNG